MELLRVDKKGFEEWVKNGNQEMCVVGGGLDRAYFRHSLSNGLDILYMYRYIRDGKLPLNREPEYQGLYKRDTKELYDVGYDLHEVIKDLDIVAHGSACAAVKAYGVINIEIQQEVLHLLIPHSVPETDEIIGAVFFLSQAGERIIIAVI